MEIEEKELDKEWLGCWAIYIKHEWMDQYAVSCQPKALKPDGSMSFIGQIRHIVVEQKV